MQEGIGSAQLPPVRNFPIGSDFRAHRAALDSVDIRQDDEKVRWWRGVRFSDRERP
jgi:hypothetical protein